MLAITGNGLKTPDAVKLAKPEVIDAKIDAFEKLLKGWPMSLKVVIPTPLRKYTAGAEVVEVEPAPFNRSSKISRRKFPGIRNSVCDETGGLRRFINIYVDGEDVRFLENLQTKAKDGAEIAIVPAISGGKL